MKRILIVEDEKDIRDTLLEILELSGYTAMTADNGIEGLSLIAKFEPDLVICDVNMPEMNGFELLNLINNKFEVKNRPATVFLTARVEEKDVIKGKELGAKAYLFKPFDHNKILNTIKEHLG